MCGNSNQNGEVHYGNGVDLLPTLGIENHFQLFVDVSAVYNLWSNSHLVLAISLHLNPTQPSSSVSICRQPVGVEKVCNYLIKTPDTTFCISIASVRATFSFESILNPGSSVVAWMVFLNSPIYWVYATQQT